MLELDCVIDVQASYYKAGAEISYYPEYVTLQEASEHLDDESRYSVSCVEQN